jgi:hypothetical protein
MRRILKLLTRLYPSAWRNRYGTEYEALLDDATPRPQDAFNVLWGAIKMQLTSRSFVRIIFPCTIAGALIAAVISFTVPPRYVSQTTVTIIAVDKSQTPDKLLSRASKAAKIDEFQSVNSHPRLTKNGCVHLFWVTTCILVNVPTCLSMRSSPK